MLQLLIKPASSLCNMRCRYCFYEDESANRSIASFGIMKPDTQAILVQKALERAMRMCAFAFQGGEPLLAGLPFYERLIALQAQYNTKKVETRYAIQTNGMLIDDDWARFFAQHQFLVGLSLDGPKDINDACRWRDTDGNGSYNGIMRAAQILNKHKVEFNILTVVTAQVARSIGKIYGFFKRNGFVYQQYIPCLDPFGEPRGQYPHSLTPALYERFLITLFDLWHVDITRGQYVSIRFFDNLYRMVRGYPPESCGMMGFCTGQYVVEADGGVYPCDFYVMDPYKIGDLKTDSFDEIEARRKAIGFVEDSLYVDEACKTCPHANLCRGGCRRDREPMVGGRLSRNYYCDALRAFYTYAVPKLVKLRI